MWSEPPIRPPVVVAHRGASAYEPENTLRAIRWALDLGVQAIEVDVRRTRDGELVLLHDETVDRTTDGTGRIVELALEDSRRLDAGRGERVPTLDEALDITKGRGTLLLELKVRGLWRDVHDQVQRSRDPEATIYLSFLTSELAELKRHHPEVRCGLLFMGAPESALANAHRARMDIAGFHEEAVTPELVGKAHRRHLRVLTWTVDDPMRARHLAGAGVEYLASNAPDVVLRALGPA